jgi:hypothetical protein
VYVTDNYAYVTGGEGLKVIDVSDPAKPAVNGSLYTGLWNDTFYSIGVYVSGNYAYITNWPEGLIIIDLLCVNTYSNVAGCISFNGAALSSIAKLKQKNKKQKSSSDSDGCFKFSDNIKRDKKAKIVIRGMPSINITETTGTVSGCIPFIYSFTIVKIKQKGTRKQKIMTDGNGCFTFQNVAHNKKIKIRIKGYVR